MLRFLTIRTNFVLNSYNYAIESHGTTAQLLYIFYQQKSKQCNFNNARGCARFAELRANSCAS